MTTEDFNAIPVFYCKDCLSLKIIAMDDIDNEEAGFCDECGSTDLGQATIEEWQAMYKEKYGTTF